MGLSYLPLAQIGLEALEWWSQSLPAEVMAPHYADILPCLDSYLKTSDKGRALACTMLLLLLHHSVFPVGNVVGLTSD